MSEQRAKDWLTKYLASFPIEADPHCEHHHWGWQPITCTCKPRTPSMHEALVAYAASEVARVREELKPAIIYLSEHTEGETRAMVEVLSFRLGFGHAAAIRALPTEAQ